jgi:hypothetical protein
MAFDQGINNTDPESEVQENAITAGENKELFGSDLSDRAGWKYYFETTLGAVNFTGLFDVAINDTHYLVAMTTAGKIYTVTSTGCTEIGTGFSTSASVRWGMAILQDSGGTPYACFANGSDEPQKWNPDENGGNTSNLSASASRATAGAYPVIFGDRLWLFQSHVAYYSDLLDLTTFSATSNHQYADDGFDIIGAFVYKGSLYASTLRDVHRSDYTGDAITPFTHTGEYVVRGQGVYTNTVAEVAGYVVCLNTNGHICVFDGVNLTPIDQNIRGYYDIITPGRVQYAWGCYYANNYEYLLSLDLGSLYNDSVLSVNFERGISSPRFNTKWTNINANCITPFNYSGELILVSGCSNAEGFIKQLDYGALDNESNISAWFSTKKYSWGSTALEKHFRGITWTTASVLNQLGLAFEVLDTGNVYTLSLTQSGAYLGTDTPAANDFWLGDDTGNGSFLVGESAAFDSYIQLFNDRANTFQLKVTSNGVNEVSKIRKATVLWQPTKYY